MAGQIRGHWLVFPGSRRLGEIATNSIILDKCHNSTYFLILKGVSWDFARFAMLGKGHAASNEMRLHFVQIHVVATTTVRVQEDSLTNMSPTHRVHVFVGGMQPLPGTTRTGSRVVDDATSVC